MPNRRLLSSFLKKEKLPMLPKEDVKEDNVIPIVVELPMPIVPKLTMPSEPIETRLNTFTPLVND